jgi:integrase
MRLYRPWYRAQTNTWYVEVLGKQQPLGKHPNHLGPPKKGKAGWNPPPEIMTAFHRLMAEDPANLPKAGEVRVAVVCDLFLDWSQKHHEPGTYEWYRHFLQDFCESYGAMPAADLKPLHVTRWLDAHSTWTGGRRNAVICVKRTFNWAESEGILTGNPLKTVKKPQQASRTRIVTEGEKKEILGAIRDGQFREFVYAMQETGARPGEVRKVTAENVNLEVGIWVLTAHKTFHKTGKPRVIYLNEEMVALTRKLVGLYPEGPLFRGPISKRGFTSNGVRCRFRTLRKKLPHLKDVIATAYRRSFATGALENGVGIAQVAELLGHVDTKMVSRHYSQLSQQVQHMRDMAKKATGKDQANPA